MTNEEMDELINKIDEADPSEQLLLATKLIEELTVNNKFYDEYEYDIDKSEKFAEDILSLSQKLKAKIEIQKINSLIKRFNKLKKTDQKSVLEEMSKIISNIEDKVCIRYCYEGEHSFSEWEKRTNYILKTVKNEIGEKKLIELKIPYWSRKCTNCGYEEIVEKEPSHLIQKRNEEMIKKRIKVLREELKELEEFE